MNEFLTLSRIAFRSLYELETVPKNLSIAEDWFDVARQNRVVGLWADTFGNALLCEEWRRHAYGQLLHSSRLTAEAERVVDELTGSVDDLRLVKGPILADQAWSRPGLRSFDDLDFRCAKNSFNALTDGLLKLGYQPKEKGIQRRENLWHFGWGISFTHPAGFFVECNHRMFPPHYPWPDRLTRYTPDLWLPLMLDQSHVECPVPALHLLLSCVHAVWHGWERLGWLVDIAGLLTQHPRLFAEAENLAGPSPFLRRSLNVGCDVADQIFGPLPDLPQRNQKQDPLIDQALDLFMREEPDVSRKIQRKIHHLLMSRRESFFYTFCRLATPGDPDFKKWPLPVRLHGLYWALRPFRYLYRER